MNNPTTEEIVKSLKICASSGDIEECLNCIGCGETVCTTALLYAAAERLDVLETELAAVKEKQRWIPVTERLPEDEGDKFVKYGFERNGEISERRFMGAACYYLHDENPHWNYEGFKGLKVTHWMEPPKEESK